MPQPVRIAVLIVVSLAVVFVVWLIWQSGM
jgi:hypothetical protein